MTAKTFSNLLARRLKAFDSLNAKDPNNVNRVKEELLRSFLVTCLMEEFASSNKILVTDGELDAEVNALRSSYPDDIAFRRVLADENISLADWKEELRKTLLERKVFAKISEKINPPNLEDLSRYYQENKEKFRFKDRILLRQIVVDDLAKAESIHEELKKKDFATIAKKYSVAPEAKNSGLVGFVEKGTVDIFDKAFALQVNSYSQVLESPYGFHIFKVEKKEPAGYESFERAKERILATLMAQKQQAEFTAWIDQQLRTNKISRDNNLINAITVETRSE